MIFGECPYCDRPVSTPMSSNTPCYSKEVCPNCNKKIIDSYSLHHIAARVEKNGVLEDIII